MGLVGVAFGVKMIAAFVVLPVFYLTYWLGAPLSRKRRIVHLCVATAVVFGVSLSWPLLVDLTPAHMRPYVGDTQNNSALSLAFEMFGVERFAGQSQPPPPPPPPSRAKDLRPPPNGRSQNVERLTAQGGRPGPLRLANRDMAGHITWLIPFAAAGFLAVTRVSRPRLPLSPLQQTVLLWGGWFAIYAVVFSLSNSPVHPYYLNMLAPPIAAMVGIGTVALWRYSQHGWRGLILLIAGIGLTAAWQAQVLSHHPDWQCWMLPIALAGSSASVLGLFATRALACRSGPQTRPTRVGKGVGLAAMTLCLAALLLSPAVWSATPALAPGGRMVPIADPALLVCVVKPEVEAKNRAAVTRLVEFLQDNRQDELYLLAVPDIHLAAPIIIETGEPVMAYGGFSGRDPILTSDQFAEMVKAGAVRYVMLTDGPSMGMMSQGFDDPIGVWVRRHGAEVSPDAWKLPPESADAPGHRIAPWGPTAKIIQHTFHSPAVRVYDCQKVSGRISWHHKPFR